MNFLEFAAQVEAADGVAPFNEASLLALRDQRGLRLQESFEFGAAVATGEDPVEFAVAPTARRHGHGARLLRTLLNQGENLFWAHGNLPGARALAAKENLSVVRTLLVLSTSGRSLAEVQIPTGVTIRTFKDSDAAAVVSVNARAFADHREQGRMDEADFARRRAEPWFDPAGLFIAERDGQIVGFHWTKIEGGTGEVYVVGVDPSAHGSGIGQALTAVGLEHLWAEGVGAIDLYVEGDNLAALAVYRKLGFTEKARDVLYCAK